MQTPISLQSELTCLEVGWLQRRGRLQLQPKLGFLDVDAWLRWRETPNRLAHEYPDHVDTRFADFLSAVGVAAKLIHGYRAWRVKLDSQLTG